MEAMERIAPCILAEEWDNPGLLIGDPAQKINKIITCLDVNEAVVNEAVEKKYDMIISHHPFIFHALKKIRTDLPMGKLIQKLLKNNIAVFAAHTNLDSAKGGINDMLCELWHLHNVQMLNVNFAEELVKLAVFVPKSHAEAVRLAIGKAGAGYIGNYSYCAFEMQGMGHFLPLAGTNPYIGEIGKIASVDEVKLETILPAKIKDRVVRAMVKAHPYEEAAYEIYPLKMTGETAGLGRIGELEKAVSFEKFAAMVKDTLQIDHIRLVRTNAREIKKVALCSGAGAEFLSTAKMRGADVYVTGDVKYHEAQKAQELNINLIDAGHFGTEYLVAKALAGKLDTYAKKNKWNIEISYDKVAKDPFVML